MLPIYICEDDKRQLENITKIITDIINTESLNNVLDVVCASQDPKIIIDKLYKNQKQSLYFLDIDLGSNQMNGLELGMEIRKLDPRGFIVVVTVHTEMTLTTFKSKIEAMDFIEKDQPYSMPERIRECIFRTLELYSLSQEDNKKILRLKNGKRFDLTDILYIEATQKQPGKILINTKISSIQVATTLSDIISKLDRAYYQCHRSYIINFRHIAKIDSFRGMAILNNGQEIPISFRRRRDTYRLYDEYTENKA